MATLIWPLLRTAHGFEGVPIKRAELWQLLLASSEKSRTVVLPRDTGRKVPGGRGPAPHHHRLSMLKGDEGLQLTATLNAGGFPVSAEHLSSPSHGPEGLLISTASWPDHCALGPPGIV